MILKNLKEKSFIVLFQKGILPIKRHLLLRQDCRLWSLIELHCCFVHLANKRLLTMSVVQAVSQQYKKDGGSS